MLGDSGALTAGAVASAPPERRGATMAVYSFLGFTAASAAPLIFGVVLDIAGGNKNLVAWGLAFASIGVFGALAPIARAVARAKSFTSRAGEAQSLSSRRALKFSVCPGL
jgi:MFS family permease